jgi:chemotaxis protein methyltransferase CheR
VTRLARGTAQEQRLSPVCAYVAERTGTSLSVQQLARLKEVLARRLARRSEEAYLAFLRSPEGATELSELMVAIAVHKTDLFRDEVQLRAFSKHVLEPMVKAAAGRPLMLWSAGCATGEEVATLLILLREAGASRDSQVLGTDISAPALKQAREMVFPPSMLRRVPPPLLSEYFEERTGGYHQLASELRERATFVRHNLMDVPYPKSPRGEGFDVIFCRNVLIYFTEQAFDRVVACLTERLRVDGALVLSAAEPILRVQPYLQTLKCEQAFFYIRRKEVAPPRVEGTSWPPRSAPPHAPTPAHSSSPAPATPASAGAVARVEPTPAKPPDGGNPLEEATRIFESVMERAASGASEAEIEQGLRQGLYLDPHLSQARYALAMMLEGRGQKADAASEYRRALAAISEGKCRQVPFFLNVERLKVACASAIERLGYR